MVISDIKTISGSVALPVTNATYYTDLLDSQYQSSILYSSQMQYWQPQHRGLFVVGAPLLVICGDYGMMRANDFTFPDASYDPPVFNGKVKIKFEDGSLLPCFLGTEVEALLLL